MITVQERYSLKPEYVTSADEVMQKLDDILGPAAHESDGWVDHARFLQDRLHRSQVVIIYPWESAESLCDLVHDEETRLGEFYATYCTKPREISVFETLAVDV